MIFYPVEYFNFLTKKKNKIRNVEDTEPHLICKLHFFEMNKLSKLKSKEKKKIRNIYLILKLFQQKKTKYLMDFKYFKRLHMCMCGCVVTGIKEIPMENYVQLISTFPSFVKTRVCVFV